MALGLIGAALKGGADAAQEIAQESLKERRERALLKIRRDYQQEIKDTEWKREQQAAAATVKREERHRLQDRKWELGDAEREHNRAIQLQKVRNQGGYGNRPTANQKEAQWLVDNGIASSIEEAWPMVASSRNQNGEMDYVENRLSELNEALEDPDFGMNLNGTEEDLNRRRQRMREERDYYQSRRDQIASERYGLQPPGSSSTRNPQPKTSPPSAAINFLRNNDTPEIRQAFEAKYGYLPEGL
ncbi:hypothetical protein [Vreelandella massiliensis]|uniref:hypothetical protein n=1 Tax=Vreelandella massiliensis TaxID=1816686 RepID=UPI00096AC384|nr:hypothetical protein [Halomonas massiliensis]